MSQTAVTTTSQKPPVIAGGKVAALVPHSLEEAFRVSQAIAASGLAPKGIEKPEQILVAIMAGAEVGLAPFQALQSIAVINGKPTLWGDGLIAVVRSHGFKVKEWFDKEESPTKAFCEVTRPDNDEVIERTFSLEDAKKANLLGKSGPWQTNQKRMLQMRARGFACRDGAADVLRGFQLREEVEDYQPIRDVTPQGTGMRARLEARTPIGGFDAEHVSAELDAALAGDRIPNHDPQTGEVIDAEVVDEPQSEAARETDAANNGAVAGEPAADEPSLFGGAPAPDPLDWAAEQNRLLDAAKTVADIDALTGAPGAREAFDALSAKSPGMAKALDAATRGKRKALADKERTQ